MSLSQWANSGWLRTHQTSPQEIAGLFAIVARDLADAEGDISVDWRFGIAYNAALKLCTILLHASGYRPEKALQHYRTIAALPEILGEQWKDDADYLETCRRKRNIVEYDRVGVVAEQDASELAAFCRELRQDVLAWLNDNHPHLTPAASRLSQ
jgi:hypothetical protein